LCWSRSPLCFEAMPRVPGLIVAGVLFTTSLARLRILQPLNTLWLKFGQVVQKVTTPIVMALLFFATIVPISALMSYEARCSTTALGSSREQLLD
jgi:hypothetical protein